MFIYLNNFMKYVAMDIHRQLDIHGQLDIQKRMYKLSFVKF